MAKYNWSRYLKALFSFALPYKKTIFMVVVFILCSVGLDLLSPIIYKHVLNDLSGVYVHKTYSERSDISAEELTRLTHTRHQHHQVFPRSVEQAFKTLVIAAIALFIINVASHFFDLMGDYFSAKYANGIEQDFVERSFEHVLRLKLPFFSKHTSASLIKRIDQVDQLGPAVTTLIEQVSAQIFRLVGASSIMFYHNKQLALLALVTMPFYLIISKNMATRLEGTSEKYLETWDDVSTKLQDNINHVKTVKVSGAEKRVAKKFRTTLENALSQYLQRSKLENRYIFLQNLCIHLGRLLVLVYGSYQVLEHRLTPGDVVMFVALLDQMYDPIDELTGHAISTQVEKVSIARGLALLDVEEEKSGDRDLVITNADVEFKDVNFSYVKGHPVLFDVSFKLPPNSYNALVGTSGSGKSTILDLLLNFYKRDSGLITVSGNDISTLNASSLRSQVGLVATDGAIFRGSVKENLLFKNPHAKKEDIEEAIHMAGLTRTIERLSHGLNTEVGDLGVGLSIGERQRLQLARMLISKPKIILLDEATANLDYNTEREIKNILLALRKTTTILVVAHRYSMVENADQVIVLDGGHIQQQGPVEKVMQQNPWFHAMALPQEEGPHGTH